MNEKLWPRLDGDGGGGCPVLTFAITPALYIDDGPPTPEKVQEVASLPPDDEEDGG